MNESIGELLLKEQKGHPRIVQEFNRADFPQRKLNKTESRISASPEVKDKMDREVVAFAKLMEGADFWWQLDGSLNISLRQIARGGDYIGVHKDIDFSVFAEDLEALRSHITAKGYGLFYMYEYEEGGESKWRFEEVEEGKAVPKFDAKFRVVAVDRTIQKIDLQADMVMAGPIMHFRGGQGEFLLWNGRQYPASWLKGESVDFKETSIILSHPARFVFNKVFYGGGGNKYHDEDLRYFVLKMRAVSKKDMADAMSVMEDSLKDYAERRAYIEALAKRIVDRVEHAQSYDEVYEIAKAEIPSDFSEKMFGLLARFDQAGNEQDKERVTQEIIQQPDMSYASVLRAIMEASYFPQNEERVHKAATRLRGLKEERDSLLD